MYTDHIITQDEHQRWFENVMNDSSRAYLLFLFGGSPAGLSYFTDIDPVSLTCVWGFYLGDTALPKGSGTILGYLSLNYIFQKRNLHKVSGEILDFNTASRKFFERLGFVREGCLRKHLLREKEYVDIVLYGILRDEWLDESRTKVFSLIEKNG